MDAPFRRRPPAARVVSGALAMGHDGGSYEDDDGVAVLRKQLKRDQVAPIFRAPRAVSDRDRSAYFGPT